MTDKPEYGKVYSLFGDGTKDAPCVANGNTWAESEVKEPDVEILEALYQRFPNESDLTLDIMRQVIRRLKLTDPQVLNDVYCTVIHWTGYHPEGHGWGSSDTNIVCDAVDKMLVRGINTPPPLAT